MSETLKCLSRFDREVIEGWRKHGIPSDHSTVEYASELVPKLLDLCDAFEELWLKAEDFGEET